MVQGRKIFFIGICFWAYVFGILTGFYGSWTQIFLSGWLNIGAAFFFVAKKKYRLLFIIGSFIFGVCLIQGHQWLYQRQRILIAGAEKIVGSIVEIKSIQDRKWLQLYVVSIESIDDQILWMQGRLQCTISKSASYQEGDRILIIKESKKISLHQKKEFDLYLAKEQLWGWLYLKPENCLLIQHNQSKIQSYFFQIKQNVKTAYKSLQEPTRTLYGTLFLFYYLSFFNPK